MDWYFLENGQRVGPLNDEQFDESVRQGKVLAGSFVWRPGMADWTTLSVYQAWQDTQAQPQIQEVSQPPRLEVRYCGQCGKSFHIEDVITFRGLFVCAECKNLFFQRLREGSMSLPVGMAKTFQVVAGAIANLPPGHDKAGTNADFGSRLAAWMIDAMLVLFALLIIGGIAGDVISRNFRHLSSSSVTILYLAEFVLFSIIYHSLTTGMFGGSLGKLMFGYRIVRSDGKKVNMAVGFMRSLVRLVSFVPLGYGFIMIMLDKDRLALHDKICDTKVARK